MASAGVSKLAGRKADTEDKAAKSKTKTATTKRKQNRSERRALSKQSKANRANGSMGMQGMGYNGAVNQKNPMMPPRLRDRAKHAFGELNKAEKHNWADKSANVDPTKKLDESISTYYDDMAKK